MASASAFTVLPIPKQFRDEALLKRLTDKYRDLRLESLKSDPDAFSSTFEAESKQPFEFWMRRLMTPRAQHFVAMRLNQDSTADSLAHDSQAVLETEWVGTLVLLGPRTVASHDESPWNSLARGRFVEANSEPSSPSDVSAYHLAGFYVAPATRGQGLGSSLVHSAVEAIAHESQKMQNAGAICTVGASHRNLAVRRLFKRMGFLEVAEEAFNTDDGRSLTEIVLRRDFLR